MSRFNNPRGFLTSPGRAFSAKSAVAAPPLGTHTLMTDSVRPAVSEPRDAMIVERRPNMGQKACFAIVNAYLLSSCANDLIFHFTRGKIHISAACMLLLPVLFLATGAWFRGLKVSSGRWFAAFALWVVLATPFSYWKGGSVDLLMNYFPRAYLVCFYLAASAISLAQVRTVLRVMGIGALFVILSCVAFGGAVMGRFAIPDSLFYGNSNELALQLLLGSIILMYPFFDGGRFLRLLSGVGIFVSLVYMLKTGSRGVLLATIGTAVLVFLTSRRRMLVALIALPALLTGFILAPSIMRHRITLLTAEPTSTDEDAAAVASMMERQKLLKLSIVLAITHPVFGVGPGQFITKTSADEQKSGERGDWLGTHNSYTQVASEDGLPAFIFYVATIATGLILNYRLYKASVGRPGLVQLTGISFCMFLCTFAYSIAIFFFHEAYSIHLPLITGVSIALYLAAQPVLKRYGEDSV